MGRHRGMFSCLECRLEPPCQPPFWRIFLSFSFSSFSSSFPSSSAPSFSSFSIYSQAVHAAVMGGNLVTVLALAMANLDSVCQRRANDLMSPLDLACALGNFEVYLWSMRVSADS